jgi:multidrug efflux pump subunit AcrA (membrane-fusion protein)
MRNYFDDMTMLFAVYSTPADSTGQASINTDKSTASGARSSIDSSISDLTSTLQSYNSSIFSLKNAQDNLSIKQEPPSADDLAVSKANLDNANSNLANAETAYASRIITAPFDGQIGGLSAEVGQQVSSSDSLGTLITSEKVINVTLNEVDAAKVSAGNPVTITFDSLPNVTITGKVSYIDPLGTVTQGVVSYSVQIRMDEQNDQVKTAMTASVSIITTQHSNTLIIPTSAITTTGGKKYVLVADTSSSSAIGLGEDFNMSSTTRNFGTSTRKNFASSTRPTGSFSASNTKTSSNIATQYPVVRIEITTGISNNTTTEVLSGLSEGQLIVTKKTTVSANTASTKTSAASATTNTKGGFGGGFGGGAVGGL